MGLKAAIKRVLPPPLDRAQASLRTGANRLGMWRGMLRECEGVTDADQAVLRASFRTGWRTLLSEPGAWREPQLIEDATIQVRDGFRYGIRARTDDLGHVRQTTHRSLLDAALAHLPPGGVAVDGGSNLGIFAANFSRKAGSDGRVLAVEMVPSTADALRRTIALNDLRNVEVAERALSGRSGETLSIHLPDDAHFGQASVRRHRGGTGTRFEATTTTLDRLTDGHDRIDVIKLDLEGAEVQALAGARRTLARTQAVLFEGRRHERPELNAIFQAAGFAIREIDAVNAIAERR